ncbi:MAG TPA: hypothetical protein VGZ00_03520 [Candidatus Baltobacteraceae bacterium]|jgi:hypothetical protein|nr:hypothetical protein [Candidatus Baltobacteraceae bacterium]
MLNRKDPEDWPIRRTLAAVPDGGGNGPNGPQFSNSLKLLFVAMYAASAVMVTTAGYIFWKTNDTNKHFDDLREKSGRVVIQQSEIAAENPITGYIQAIDSRKYEIAIKTLGTNLVMVTYNPRIFQNLHLGDLVEAEILSDGDRIPELTKCLWSKPSRVRETLPSNNWASRTRVP